MNKGIRITLGLLTGFVALTAIGGGIAMLVGAEAQRFPLAWLEGTPFADYTIPALLLAIAVGGSALAACVAIFINPKISTIISALAGLTLIGYVTVEVLILKQVPPGPTVIELFYLAIGLVILALAAFTWQRAYRQPQASRKA